VNFTLAVTDYLTRRNVCFTFFLINKTLHFESIVALDYGKLAYFVLIDSIMLFDKDLVFKRLKISFHVVNLWFFCLMRFFSWRRGFSHVKNQICWVLWVQDFSWSFSPGKFDVSWRLVSLRALASFWAIVWTPFSRLILFICIERQRLFFRVGKCSKFFLNHNISRLSLDYGLLLLSLMSFVLTRSVVLVQHFAKVPFSFLWSDVRSHLFLLIK